MRASWNRRTEPAPTTPRADAPRPCRRGLCPPISWSRQCRDGRNAVEIYHLATRDDFIMASDHDHADDAGPEPDERLMEVLDAYLRAVESGQSLDRTEWLAQYPD